MEKRMPVRMPLRRKLFTNAKKVAPLKLPASRQNRNFPSRSRTAPNHSTLHRVASGAVLLEVHLVGSPEIHGRILHQRLKSF